MYIVLSHKPLLMKTNVNNTVEILSKTYVHDSEPMNQDFTNLK